MMPAAILALLGILHIYWAAGGSFGKNATLPTEKGKAVLQPTPFLTSMVAVGLFAMATLVALHRMVWLITAIFLIRAIGDFRYVGFFKRVRDSGFARMDTFVYSPLCLLLAALSAISYRS